MGQCSMTVAMPILSACGHETCILPTALLSTHTGGFGKPVVVHMGEALEGMWRHWKENQISFDAILVGYLGSVAAIEIAEQILSEMLAPGGISIVDPAMADHGKLYSGFDEAYAKASVFGALIAPGVMSFLSVWAKYLEVDFFGKELLAGKSTKIEWIQPVYAQDVLTGRAEITRLQRRNAKNGLVEISIQAYNQNGDLVLTDVTEAIVKCKIPDTI